MNFTKLEIIIPVFNEGEKVLNLIEKFNKNIKTNFKVLICYDLDTDEFNYTDEFKKYSFEIN